jgi:predicted lipoprotein with Yx(FWY)xxD motif
MGGSVGVVCVGAVVAGLAGSAQAVPGSAARLSVRSTAYGKALFGPSGKVLYVFGADRGRTSRCYGVCDRSVRDGSAWGERAKAG